MKKILPLLIIQLFTIDCILAQGKAEIPGTHLSLNLKNGFVIDEDSATIYNEKCGITFIEMAGINFYSKLDDFNDIEEKYAQKGIRVKKNFKGRIGKYDAQFINLDSKPPVNQIFFGDSLFCAIANITAIDSTIIISESEIDTILSSIEFYDNKKSALNEHANFILKDLNKEWIFETYIANTFGFENKKTNDAFLISQFPLMTLMRSSKEDLANEFIGKFKSTIPNLKIVEQGNWQTSHFDAYRVILDVSQDSKMELIYLFIFSSNKSVFVFQGLGIKNDSDTKKKYESLLNNLELKE